ncbi:MAG: 5-methyltetrahydrofolate--homocysteine methyltransferase, partial [Alistipes sp.]|nr:5-methyltetrahydrofolate--homocysteine methyltransferase [Alistipes sp.]
TGMKLTDNCMIDPGEALCGLFFADADYFSVGPIDECQLADYARRRSMEPDQIRKLIPGNL